MSIPEVSKIVTDATMMIYLNYNTNMISEM